MHTGGRRIARVVLLSAAAGVALAEGDVAAALDHGATPTREATELGVERELPLIRAVRAQALLASGDLPPPPSGLSLPSSAARSLAFDFPLAICFETAALVSLAAGTPDHDAIGLLLGVSADLRDRGDRPALPSLRDDVYEAEAVVGPRGRGPLDRARIDHACTTAVGLLERVITR